MNNLKITFDNRMNLISFDSTIENKKTVAYIDSIFSSDVNHVFWREQTALSPGPPAFAAAGGSNKNPKVKSHASVWAKTRTTMLVDGRKRALYRNPRHPGELRLRTYVTGKDGRKKVKYVKAKA